MEIGDAWSFDPEEDSLLPAFRTTDDGPPAKKAKTESKRGSPMFIKYLPQTDQGYLDLSDILGDEATFNVADVLDMWYPRSDPFRIKKEAEAKEAREASEDR